MKKIHLLNENLKPKCGSMATQVTQETSEVNCSKCLNETKKPVKYRLPDSTLRLMKIKIKKGSHTDFVNQAIIEKLARMTEGQFSMEASKPEPSIFRVKALSDSDGKRGVTTQTMFNLKESERLENYFKTNFSSGYNQERLRQNNQTTSEENHS